MPQVGVYSAYQLGLHNHLDDNNGGLLNDYSRYGAYREAYAAGTAITFPNDAEVTVINPAYDLIKEIRVNKAILGTFYISWRMRNSDGVTSVRSKFYVNGVAKSPEKATTSNVYAGQNYTYSVDLAAGDLLQIYGYSVAGADAIFIDQFRIRFGYQILYFGDGTKFNLTSALALSDTDAPDMTVII